jgi:hypothetical protein
MSYEEAICSMGESVLCSRRQLSEIECESRKVELHWNNIKKFVLGSMSDLMEKPERRTRKPWNTQEVISQIDGRGKWRNVNNEDGRNKWRRSIFRSYVTGSRKFKERDFMI